MMDGLVVLLDEGKTMYPPDLRAARLKQDLTQGEAARTLGVALVSYQQWEMGRRAVSRKLLPLVEAFIKGEVPVQRNPPPEYYPPLHCLRCGHVWAPLRRERPKECQKCTSQHWDVPLEEKRMDDETMARVAEQIRKLRHGLELSQAKLAKKVGVAQATIARIELGERVTRKTADRVLRKLKSSLAAMGISKTGLEE